MLRLAQFRRWSLLALERTLEPLAKLLSFTPGFNRVVKAPQELLTVSTVFIAN
jgi:hypothetical protein